MSKLTEEIKQAVYELNHEFIHENMAFRRNHKSYEFSSYLNHAVAFFYADNYVGMALFLVRAEHYLEKNESLVNGAYLERAARFLTLAKEFILSECKDKKARQYYEER